MSNTETQNPAPAPLSDEKARKLHDAAIDVANAVLPETIRDLMARYGQVIAPLGPVPAVLLSAVIASSFVKSVEMTILHNYGEAGVGLFKSQVLANALRGNRDTRLGGEIEVDSKGNITNEVRHDNVSPTHGAPASVQ